MSYKDYLVYGIVAVLIVVFGIALYMGRGNRGSDGPAVAGKEVVYAESGFSPANLVVKVGDTVTFKNQSSEQLWVASAPHPTHVGLPGFDALRGYAPGESYTYTFAKVGVWGYHNHLKPSLFGRVTVE